MISGNGTKKCVRCNFQNTTSDFKVEWFKILLLTQFIIRIA